MEKIYYSFDGYRCSKEQAEAELRAFKKAIPKVTEKDFKIPRVYGTAGEQEYGKFTKEQLEKIIEEVFKDPKEKKEREVKLLTGCKTNGWTDLALDNLCSDPECISCSSFRKAVIGDAKDWKP